jgi:hypothetical protein
LREGAEIKREEKKRERKKEGRKKRKKKKVRKRRRGAEEEGERRRGEVEKSDLGEGERKSRVRGSKGSLGCDAEVTKLGVSGSLFKFNFTFLYKYSIFFVFSLKQLKQY